MKIFLICVAALAMAYGILLLGMRIGEDQGRTIYHADFLRPIQVEIFELSKVIESGDLEAASKKANTVSELAGAAGNHERFGELLKEEE